jgi:predicted amidohydrolase YtcJ
MVIQSLKLYLKSLVRSFIALVLLIAFTSKLYAQADLIIYNAKIITMDHSHPEAQAFAVKNGMFLAVGTNDEMRVYSDDRTNWINANGKTVIPGIIDSHMHPDPTYAFDSIHHVLDLSPDSAETIEDLISLLKRKAEITPEGQWIRGTLYQDTKLGRHPDRFDLDMVSDRHPIMITHSSHHVFVVNSYALTMAGLLDTVDDPPGGAFDRTEDGRPNGILREPPALNLVLNGNIPFPEPDLEEELQAYMNTFQRFIEKGITSIADAALETDKFSVFYELVNRGMPVRIYHMYGIEKIESLSRLGIQTGFGNEQLKIGSIKVFHGNSLSGQTCWLSVPYEGRPDYYGIPPDRSQDELNELILSIHRANLQAAIHANGDREMEMVLDAIEYALNHYPKADHRHRIEHASVVTQAILERVKSLNVILAPHSYIYEHGDKMGAYGEWRWPWMHPNRKALDLGIIVAGNSDYPVSAADPMLRVQSLVTRTSAEGVVYGPNEILTPEEAIYTFTMGSAIAQFEEDIKGSITKGKFADFVVLSDDPASVDPFTIKDIDVLHTFINGVEVYRNDTVIIHE